ncbi:TolC family protein [Telmatocola sphagniphila]|uniref:TolC family protein n=1 Tax=Telmatocola sphagniphila TaxID=1123043 RepID=A0A8E6ETZ1_9BACT|nr:hypothetical protein [Telmatocola sphagniphila]QVL33034.1 TolC family protein [Telmatocola sphagniphila]
MTMGICKWGFKSLFAALALSGALGTSAAFADDVFKKTSKKQEPAPVAQVAPAVQKYTLGQCLAIGMERAPSLKAARAALNAAQWGRKGLDDVGRLGSLLTPDLEIRKQQSCTGLEAIQAEIQAAEQEITYSVVRTYYMVIYAREQYKLTKELAIQLDVYLAQVQAIVNSKDGGNKDINKNTEDRLVIARSEAIIKRNQAEAGILQAFAALREAMGIGPNEPLEIADEKLPEIKAEITRETVLSHATSRRSEIKLAEVGLEVTKLEVLAQSSGHFRRKVPTFAQGSDIHSIPIPTGSKEANYRPEALAPRMPAQLVGTKESRTAQAAAYSEYAAALLEKTKGLLTLEAENAFQKYREATSNVAETKVASKTGISMIERLRKAQGNKLDESLILTGEASSTLANARFNEALIEQIVALANLERITAGGIRVNYPGR